MMCRFLHRVFTIYSIVKRAIFSRRIRYFPFTSLSSLSHPLSRVTGAYIDLQGVAPGVDPCIIFAGIYNCWAHRSKSKYTAHCNLGLKLTTGWCLVLAATLKHFIWFTPHPLNFSTNFRLGGFVRQRKTFSWVYEEAPYDPYLLREVMECRFVFRLHNSFDRE